MPIWSNAVTKAVKRHVAETGSRYFTRKAFLAAELSAIEEETQTTGLTPSQTLGRELQQLRNEGLLEFLGAGRYRWLGSIPGSEPEVRSKGLFLLPNSPERNEQPERMYTFEARWLGPASRMIDEWVVYQTQGDSGSSEYVAVGRVEGVDADPSREASLVAKIAHGSYLEFGRPVPFRHGSEVVEQGLLKPDGQIDLKRAAQPVRLISSADFNRILELGLVTEEELLPRAESDAGTPPAQMLSEEHSDWLGPVDRVTMLVERKVRNRQFRKRVLDAYGSRCALTGMQLINGGGRAETEAAHIMSVEAGGPDAVNNGIALSGTIHWMFDRGLISLSDVGEILLSRAINDIEGVERLIHRDRRARFPNVAAHRPHPRYLAWHRSECFHD